jgi:hypothetical protein
MASQNKELLYRPCQVPFPLLGLVEVVVRAALTQGPAVTGPQRDRPASTEASRGETARASRCRRRTSQGRRRLRPSAEELVLRTAIAKDQHEALRMGGRSWERPRRRYPRPSAGRHRPWNSAKCQRATANDANVFLHVRPLLPALSSLARKPSKVLLIRRAGFESLAAHLKEPWSEQDFCLQPSSIGCSWAQTGHRTLSGVPVQCPSAVSRAGPVGRSCASAASESTRGGELACRESAGALSDPGTARRTVRTGIRYEKREPWARSLAHQLDRTGDSKLPRPPRRASAFGNP